jgi:pimeloyl-ACP methyl ester carboxylesterase
VPVVHDLGSAAATSDTVRPDPHESADEVSAWHGHPVLELRCSAELARLLVDPVFRGHGVPHGDGRSVLLLPGFLAPDCSLRLLAQFLRRIEYRPVLSGIRFNSGCGNTFDQRIVRTVMREHARSGRRLAVIGHSRGGHYARSLATRHPDLISHIVTVGSAVEDPLDVSILTKHAAAAVRAIATTHDREKQQRGCLTLGCTCEFSRGFAQPFPAQVKFTSIHSRDDGVVRWGSCIADYATCVEVTGSHVGLAFNRQAFRAVARALAVR